MEMHCLICPYCGSDYLHQREVRAIWRLEDEDGIEHRSNINGSGVFKRKENTIFGRRDVIEIDFECEDCEKKPELFIQQHKGQTHIEWGNL